MSKPIGKMNLKELKDFVADKIEEYGGYEDGSVDDYCEDDFFSEVCYKNISLGGLEIKDAICELKEAHKQYKKYGPISFDCFESVGFSYFRPLTLDEARKKVLYFNNKRKTGGSIKSTQGRGKKRLKGN